MKGQRNENRITQNRLDSSRHSRNRRIPVASYRWRGCSISLHRIYYKRWRCHRKLGRILPLRKHTHRANQASIRNPTRPILHLHAERGRRHNHRPHLRPRHLHVPDVWAWRERYGAVRERRHRNRQHQLPHIRKPLHRRLHHRSHHLPTSSSRRLYAHRVRIAGRIAAHRHADTRRG